MDRHRSRLLSVIEPPRSGPLTQQVRLTRLGPLGRRSSHGSLDVVLAYDPADPWAVELRFAAGGRTVRWLVARELLLQGLRGPAGDGDVRLRPSADEVGRPVLVVEFRSPSGRLVARTPTRPIQRFLDRTLAVLPRGAEAIDLDRLVASLTGPRAA